MGLLRYSYRFSRILAAPYLQRSGSDRFSKQPLIFNDTYSASVRTEIGVAISNFPDQLIAEPMVEAGCFLVGFGDGQFSVPESALCHQPLCHCQQPRADVKVLQPWGHSEGPE
jgi:hypothetical protein